MILQPGTSEVFEAEKYWFHALLKNSLSTYISSVQIVVNNPLTIFLMKTLAMVVTTKHKC